MGVLREKSAREDVPYELRRREKGGGGGGHESLRVASFFGADERGREHEYVAGRAYREKGWCDLGGKTYDYELRCGGGPPGPITQVVFFCFFIIVFFFLSICRP